MNQEIPNVPGSDAVVAWFGEWPSFHDAEILELHLDRENVSWVKVHVWLSSGETYEHNGKQYRRERHGVVTFRLAEIVDLELYDSSCQNVIFGLELERKAGAYRPLMKPCYGLSGYIEAGRIELEVTPHIRTHGDPLSSPNP